MYWRSPAAPVASPLSLKLSHLARATQWSRAAATDENRRVSGQCAGAVVGVWVVVCVRGGMWWYGGLW